VDVDAWLAMTAMSDTLPTSVSSISAEIITTRNTTPGVQTSSDLGQNLSDLLTRLVFRHPDVQTIYSMFALDC